MTIYHLLLNTVWYFVVSAWLFPKTVLVIVVVH